MDSKETIIYICILVFFVLYTSPLIISGFLNGFYCKNKTYFNADTFCITFFSSKKCGVDHGKEMYSFYCEVKEKIKSNAELLSSKAHLMCEYLTIELLLLLVVVRFFPLFLPRFHSL